MANCFHSSLQRPTSVDTHHPQSRWHTPWLAAAVCIAAFVLAACGGGGGGGGGAAGVAASPPAAAAARAPVLEPASAATATVGAGGGSVVATAASGITYTLVIPAGALTADVAITLTPILDMGSAPLAASVLGAVQMEPSGLKFRIAATLRIDGAQGLPSGQQLVGFSTANDGSGFGLSLVRVEGASTLVNVTHFSTGGAAGAPPAQLPPLVPLAPTLVNADDAIAQLAELTARNAGLVDIAAVFVRWYEDIVKPALDRADGSTDAGFQIDAIIAYQAWISTMDFIADRNSLELALATELRESAPIATRVFKAFINGNIDDCANPSLTVAASLSALSLASDAQNIAQSIGLAGAGSGLDRATFLLRANNCLRPVMDPITLPTPLTIGTPKSLDAKARVVFNGILAPEAAPFEFTVTPTGATVARPVGLSDAAGAYTTVFTPTSTDVSMTVKACLVLDKLTNAGSDICVTRQVAPQAVSASSTINWFALSRAADKCTDKVNSGQREVEGELVFDVVSLPLPLSSSLPTCVEGTGSISVTSKVSGRVETISVSGTYLADADFARGDRSSEVRGEINIKVEITQPSVVTLSVLPAYTSLSPGLRSSGFTNQVFADWHAEFTGTANRLPSLQAAYRAQTLYPLGGIGSVVTQLLVPGQTATLEPGSYELRQNIRLSCSSGDASRCTVGATGELAKLVITPVP